MNDATYIEVIGGKYEGWKGFVQNNGSLLVNKLRVVIYKDTLCKRIGLEKDYIKMIESKMKEVAR